VTVTSRKQRGLLPHATVGTVLAAATSAHAYVGPGAGAGSAGIGITGLVVLLLAGAVGVCVLGGLVSLAYAAGRRLLTCGRSPSSAGRPPVKHRPAAPVSQ
jgi:hypothetical protein